VIAGLPGDVGNGMGDLFDDACGSAGETNDDGDGDND